MKKELKPRDKFFERMMSGVMVRVAGGDRVEDVEVLRADKELVDSSGWNQAAGADTVSNFMKRKSNNDRCQKVNESMVIKAIAKSDWQEFTYDNDAMYIDCKKRSASYSYQGNKQLNRWIGLKCIMDGWGREKFFQIF